LERAAVAIVDAVTKSEGFAGVRGNFDPGIIEHIVRASTELFDAKYGGFGRAPKFPHSQAVDLLLEQYQTTREERLLHIVERTLVNMASGGVYDQLAGGFHRYSVDERWLVPHFEKMSYDNSELLKNYVHAWQVTGKPFFREVAEGIIGWVDETLSDQRQGGFYASQDADYSLDDDGDFFTWTLQELRAVLSPDESRVAELHFDVEAHGEMHHNPAKNVLWIARGPAEIATQLGKTEGDVRQILAAARRKLLAARILRPTPTVDTTIYVGWNAMFASAYFSAARAFGGEVGARCAEDSGSIARWSLGRCARIFSPTGRRVAARNARRSRLHGARAPRRLRSYLGSKIFHRRRTRNGARSGSALGFRWWWIF
jgi:uncharacterized protein YyaL (SSP411 family)